MTDLRNHTDKKCSLDDRIEQVFVSMAKVIHPKYSKHRLYYTVIHTIDCVWSKILNPGLFLTLFKLIPCQVSFELFGALSIYIFLSTDYGHPMKA